MKIGLFGGTFHPIHFGHINLAIQLAEKEGLDEVWWIPTSGSPLRNPPADVSAKHRFQMVELALSGIEQFKVIDPEINKAPPVYTIDTVKQLLEKEPDHDFSLMLSERTIGDFLAWKEVDILVDLVNLLIGCKEGYLAPKFPPKIAAAVEAGRRVTPLFDLSATQVRDRLKKKLYCGHLVPAKVLDYISINQLYFSV